MTLTNCYATLAETKADQAISDTINDTILDYAINAASRQIDGYTGRRFWQDGSVVARTYYADDASMVVTDDISTTTGLIVKTDSADDGTFATTLTITTAFVLGPLNVAAMVPVHPFETIQAVSGYTFMTGERPGVQVTAKFGWPAVPDDVRKACIIQSWQLAKSSSAPFGVISFGDTGFMQMRSPMNPQAAALLEPYVRRNRPRS